VNADGSLAYEEVARNGVQDAVAYVEALSCGASYDKEDLALHVPHPSQVRVMDCLIRRF